MNLIKNYIEKSDRHDEFREMIRKIENENQHIGAEKMSARRMIQRKLKELDLSAYLVDTLEGLDSDDETREQYGDYSKYDDFDDLIEINGMEVWGYIKIGDDFIKLLIEYMNDGCYEFSFYLEKVEVYEIPMEVFETE